MIFFFDFYPIFKTYLPLQFLSYKKILVSFYSGSIHCPTLHISFFFQYQSRFLAKKLLVKAFLKGLKFTKKYTAFSTFILMGTKWHHKIEKNLNIRIDHLQLVSIDRGIWANASLEAPMRMDNLSYITRCQTEALNCTKEQRAVQNVQKWMLLCY